MTRPTIHFYLSSDAAGHQSIDPRDPTGSFYGGGSRAGFLGLVRAMARRGDYDVTAFAAINTRECQVDGVHYVRVDNHRKYPAPDVCFAYYDGQFIHGANRAKLRIHSLHTYLPFNPSFPWPHVWTAPSEHTAEAFRRGYRPRDPVHVLPNAVEGLDHVTWNPVPGRCLWHTSPDRGLHLLLEAWPEIKARVPHATLHIGGKPEEVIRGGFYEGMEGTYEQWRSLQMANNLAAAKKAGGVTLYGHVSRDEVLRELSEANAFCFSSEMSMPSETFSISVLECCTIGVPVVLAPEDALGEVYADSGVVLTRAPADQYLHEYADAVVSVLTDERAARIISEKERAWSRRFSFDKSAAILDGLIGRYLLNAPPMEWTA